MNDDDSDLDEIAQLLSTGPNLGTRRVNAVERRACVVHNDLLVAWGAADEGDLPTWDDAMAIADHEFEILCNALGSWAERSTTEVFPRSQRRRRPLPHD